MIANIEIKKYGMVISDNEVGEKIYQEISECLKKTEVITIDFLDVKSMATFCSKQIFGKLYLELGASKFYERIQMKNVNSDVRLLIRIGIEEALDKQ